MMDYTAFVESLKEHIPPAGLPPLLRALWYEKNKDWDQAHDIAQDIHTTDGSWVHAYLHRQEGDIGNARYWYTRAGKTLPPVSLEEEWESLVKAFLRKS